MKLENISSNSDVLEYIEGTTNDFRDGVSNQQETNHAILDLYLLGAARAIKAENKLEAIKKLCDAEIVALEKIDCKVFKGIIQQFDLILQVINDSEDVPF